MIVHNWASTIILILMIDTQMCMGINKWFTGKGVGYDPEAKAETGNEWLVRFVPTNHFLVDITKSTIFWLILFSNQPYFG